MRRLLVALVVLAAVACLPPPQRGQTWESWEEAPPPDPPPDENEITEEDLAFEAAPLQRETPATWYRRGQIELKRRNQGGRSMVDDVRTQVRDANHPPPAADREPEPTYKRPPAYNPPGPTCTKGCRCGNSCIACSKRCRK